MSLVYTDIIIKKHQSIIQRVIYAYTHVYIPCIFVERKALQLHLKTFASLFVPPESRWPDQLLISVYEALAVPSRFRAHLEFVEPGMCAR